MSKSFLYSAFGLIWNSIDLKLPELSAIKNNDNFDVTISQDINNEWPSIKFSDYDTHNLKVAPNDLRLKINNIASFRVVNGKEIFWKKEKSSVGFQDIRTFLLGSPFGALLIQKDFLVFHGNALVKNGKAIMFLGHSGVGKSTIAYGLMNSGWKLIADDLVVLNKEGYVLPGVRRIKLWEDAMKAYKLDTSQFPRCREKINKYLITGNYIDEAINPSKLNSIYILNDIKKADSLSKDLVIPIKSQKEKILFLRNHTFRPRFVRALGKEGLNFIAIAKFVDIMPVNIIPNIMGIKKMIDFLSKINLLNS